MKRFSILIGCLLAVFALGLSGGCARKEAAPDPKQAKGGKDKDGKDKAGHKKDHVHGEGPHGGTVADWGGGAYHVEFKVDHDKQEATVYVLGSDEKTPEAVKTKDGKLTLLIKEPAFSLDLKAVPQKGEPAGSFSVYVGTHKNLGIVREFEGTITALVDGTPYSGDFKEEPHEKKK